ncbi:MAG: response regulator transcription factor, partial [Cyanobacteriota bacterium]|nr:response regulator transcription factor [Cyanobacteriota bacterium]
DDYLVKPFHAQELIAKVKGNVARLQRLQDSIQTPCPEPVPTKDSPPEVLTAAELKVFWQVIQGFTNKEIAHHLFLSPRTVQTHLSNILAKLGLKNRSQLVKYAFENGYTAPEYAQG